MKHPINVSVSQIKRVSNSSRSVRELGRKLGYKNPGSNTLTRFRNVLGPITYDDLSSGQRARTNKKNWVTIK